MRLDWSEAGAAFFEAILATIPEPIWLADHAGLIRYANPAALAVLGYDDNAELDGKSSHETLQSTHRDGAAFPVEESAMRRTLATGEAMAVTEDWFVARDGSMIPVSLSWSPIDMPGGRGAVLVFEHIEADGGDRAEEGRAAQRRIIEGGDEARRRLSRDLHDGAQQQLVMSALNLQLAQQHWTDPAEARRHVDAARDQVEASRAALRDLVAGIHPQILTHFGLSVAVEELAARLPVPARLDLTEERLPRAFEASIYFVVSEALTNVVKHANASEVAISIAVEHGRLTLEIRDDGVGGAESTKRGSGLSGLADRVAALGGELTVLSPPGQGTTLRATAPVSRVRAT